jgi:methyl coenzyme M reductase subunit C-like uncharacterized protein (methanogenesis marker protein 7)
VPLEVHVDSGEQQQRALKVIGLAGAVLPEDARSFVDEKQVVEEVDGALAVAGNFGVGMCKLDEGVSVIPHLMISLVVLEGLREIFPQHVYLPHLIEAFALAQSHQL